jgi:hypothetical protein
MSGCLLLLIPLCPPNKIDPKHIYGLNPIPIMLKSSLGREQDVVDVGVTIILGRPIHSVLNREEKVQIIKVFWNILD